MSSQRPCVDSLDSVSTEGHCPSPWNFLEAVRTTVARPSSDIWRSREPDGPRVAANLNDS